MPSYAYNYVQIVLSVCLLLGVGMLALPAHADRIDNLKDEIDEKTGQITEIEEEIAQIQQELLGVVGEKQTLQSTIDELNGTRRKLLSEINLNERKIEGTELSIEKIGIEITDKERRMQQNSSALGETLRRIQETDQISLIETLLSYETISNFFDVSEQLSQVQLILAEDLNDLEALRGSLLGDKQELNDESKSLQNLQRELSGRKQSVDTTKAAKDQLLAVTQNEEVAYQQLIAEKRAAQRLFLQDLADIESQLQREIDPTRIPEPGSGVLLWPLDDVFITQQFGKTVDAGRLYTSGTHNGVDLRARTPQRTLAALNGVVEATGNTDSISGCLSYGQWVLLKHNNGLSTLYAHLSSIGVTPGTAVDTGDVIGFTGNTGYSTAPHLHFSVYTTQAVSVTRLGDIKAKTNCANAHIPVAPPDGYLNPLDYLPQV